MDEQMKQFFEMVSQPVFLAKDDQIVWCNSIARSLLLEGAILSQLMGKSSALFEQWDREGCLHIPLSIGYAEYDATVRSVPEGTLFVASHHNTELNATANAAVNFSVSLRKPLHSLINAAGELFENLEECGSSNTAAAAQLNQTIYQVMRLCGQLSDGGRLILHRKTPHKEATDLGEFFRQFITQAGPLIESSGRHLEFTPLSTPLRADVDTALLERALYNLISNSMNYTPKGGKISLSLQKTGKMLFVSVCDDGEGLSEQVRSTLFERFPEHSIGDSRWGIGLGLPMVREIARLHGGDIMVGSNSSGKGTNVTFSLSLERGALELRSRTVRYDYCEGFHHGLVELSDVLDANMFNPAEV